MSVSTLYSLFSIYCVLAVAYNLVSILLDATSGKRAAPTDPQSGILFISALYLVVTLGQHYPGWLNLFFLASLVSLTIHSGIVRHVWGYSAEKYYSRLTWASAFLINTFGATVIILILFTSIARY
jgi:hypothetical protein